MKKLPTPYSFKTIRETVKAFESLLNSKEELDKNEDILPFFNHYPTLILELSMFVGMRHLLIDEFEFNFQLSKNRICDIAFGNSQKNTYCLIKLEDAKKNSLFSDDSDNYRVFSPDFENSNSQIIDWLWTIDNSRNRADLNDKFASENPDISTVLIMGRSAFLNEEERERLMWRKEKTRINSEQIKYITYDELLDFFKTLIREHDFLLGKKATPQYI